MSIFHIQHVGVGRKVFVTADGHMGMENSHLSLLGIVAALGTLLFGLIVPQNIIFGVIAAASVLAVMQALAHGNQRLGGVLALAGGIVAASVLMPGVDFYAAVVVAATLVGAAGAAIREGPRPAAAVAFAGGIVALAVTGRQPKVMLAAVITAAGVLFVWNQFGGAFSNPN